MFTTNAHAFDENVTVAVKNLEVSGSHTLELSGFGGTIVLFVNSLEQIEAISSQLQERIDAMKGAGVHDAAEDANNGASINLPGLRSVV